ncbi:conserved hypothetical protein [Talaromyces stipitatus ATCC 10500]|uniref:MULE transposase domain-containing protein n=1 Tax=Talaromyces stipitatus (strain ATCC 10500 / CBS 375.48 / QM 6759 / NRRL 1006) TaxID=441959 RepID=B8MEN3_TALSN|nr:uncharacterized protein TSTA_019770 [Talaromyces stipitatus ATCC 10500]EED16916.1 conserved hypothetical protein [Talaromyces stipitatus ATCC 10500]
MPLLDIVGCTGTNKTFWVGFGFMKNKKEKSYSFILKSLEQVIFRMGLGHPKIIITNKDQALMGAIEAIFPYTRNILCIWHIQKNLMVKCRPALRQEVIRIDYEGKGMKSTLVDEFKEKVEAHWVAFWQDFIKLVNAYTEEEKDAEWNNFRAKYSHNMWDTVFEYIKKEWLQEDTAKHFLKCYTNEYLHLNKQASLQVEGAHWIIKRDLGTSTMDLLGATLSIEMTIEKQHQKIWQEIEDERVRIKIDFKNLWLFKHVLKKVSSHALKIIHSIFERYLPESAPDKKPIKPCTGVTRRTLGIPCIHIIKEYYEADTSIELFEFCPHWRLHTDENLSPVDPRELVLEPEVIRPRGRPPGVINWPTTSEQSHRGRGSGHVRGSRGGGQARSGRGARQRGCGSYGGGQAGRGRGGRQQGGECGSGSAGTSEVSTQSHENDDNEISENRDDKTNENQIRRSKRRGRGQPAPWLGDENE